MKPESIEKIRVICYTSASPEIIWPEHPEKIEIKYVPLKSLKPFILKSLFFQIYTWLFQGKLLQSNAKTITMGVCSFVGDIVNIQFSHKIWEELYFKFIPTPFFKRVYKKVLLRYLSICEKIYYSKEGLQFVFLSEFMAKELTKSFNIQEDNYSIAYSSADMAFFGPNQKNGRQDRINYIKENYPQLKNLDEKKPVLLFVGAYERKGLPSIVEKVSNEINFIIIGKGERGSLFNLPDKENFFHIEFTKEINSFFNACDAFIFPTSFEPFGLVVLEAYASGMKVFVSEDRVGATEIIKGTEGVTLIEATDESIPKVDILENNHRLANFEKRKAVLEKYNWQKCSDQWQKVLTS